VLAGEASVEVQRWLPYRMQAPSSKLAPSLRVVLSSLCLGAVWPQGGGWAEGPLT
jgi:hypothetical protein